MAKSKTQSNKHSSELANKLKLLEQELLDKKIRDASVELKSGEIAITKDERTVFVAIPTPMGTITLQLNIGMFGLFAPNRGIVLPRNLVREIAAIVPQDGAAILDVSKLQTEVLNTLVKPGSAESVDSEVEVEETEEEKSKEKEELEA